MIVKSEFAKMTYSCIISRELWEHLNQEIPDGRWQEWKSRHAPAWFLRRFPVKYRRRADRYIAFIDWANGEETR